tara:strand:- start:29784 stop:30365 length:582 start_codon:yes stop_codon:yes gene_type:complete
MWNLIRLPFAALFATLIVFFWGVISWIKFDWHNTTIHRFENEAAMEVAIRENVSEPGMYWLPRMTDDEAGDSTANEAYQIRKNAGPFFFGFVRPGELASGNSAERNQILHLTFLFLSAVVMGVILWIARIRTYLGRVGFVTLMALFSAMVTHIPYWTWFEFSVGHTIASMGDTLIGWTLGGFALATLIWPSDD